MNALSFCDLILSGIFEKSFHPRVFLYKMLQDRSPGFGEIII